jgi:CubicO group peptidase (beta-lactamase class C family)
LKTFPCRFTIGEMNRSRHARFAALALLLTALGAAAEDRPHLTAEQVDKAVAALDALAAKQNAVPGFAVAVVFQDKAVYAKGFGVRDVNGKASVNADTVFQLASVSKPIGAAVVAAFIGDGKITWDSRLNELDPTFVMFDPWLTHEVTIRDMYAHRSGLPDHAGDLLEDLGFTRAEILRRLRYQHPDSSFRSHYAYTNFGITAAAGAAVKAWGMEWEAASEEKLYKPLGMTATSSRHSDFVGRANKALGHVLVDGKWVQKFQRDPDTEAPAGGVSSSVSDLAKWMRLELANGKFEGKAIVNEKALIEARRPHMLTGYNPFTGMPTFYGLGWNVSYDDHGRLHLNHSGAFDLGAATYVHLLPGEQLGIVVLSNAYPIGFAEGLGTTFVDLALYGNSTQDWFALFKKVFSNPATLGVTPGFDYTKAPASPAAALKSEAYAGTYRNDFFGEVSVKEQNGALAMNVGSKSFSLRHYDRDTFAYQTEGENAVGLSGVIFTIGPDGKATEMRVENFNIHGEGTFKRVPR